MPFVPRLCLAAALVGTAAPVTAASVGEAHLRASSPSAPLRDADHRPDLRVTLWYPAVCGTAETRRVVGPPTAPLFEGGSAGDDAAPAPDPARLGVAGFSAGGFTALVAAGARVDLAHFDRFCADHPDDGVCRPQAEMPDLAAHDRASAFDDSAMREAEGRASADHAIPGARAVFAMAPALVQALDPASLRALAVPVEIVLGAADRVAPPATNGEAAARLLPDAELVVLDGIGHYDFLSSCTEAGRAAVPLCRLGRPQGETHRDVVARAVAFFAEALKSAAKGVDEAAPLRRP